MPRDPSRDIWSGGGVTRYEGRSDLPPPDPAAPPTSTSAEQGSLFSPDVEAGFAAEPLVSHGDDAGYGAPTACQAAGITYRQLDYWARTGLVEPSVRPASGSGTHRLYSFRDILVLKVVKRLLDTGVSLQNIRAALAHLQERGVDDLARLTLMSDGATVYELGSSEEVIDLLRRGQGVFGIAVGPIVREVEGTLARLPVDAGAQPAAPAGESAADELASRRRRRDSA
jgi:DNA-binding transcriptional MerR regulator